MSTGSRSAVVSSWSTADCRSGRTSSSFCSVWGQADTVIRVDSNLAIRLTDARTETVYDQSGFYDIVWRVLGRRCPGLAKLDLYRFFENSVKPRIRQEQQDLSKGLWGLHRLTSHAAGVPYCGVSFGYTGLTEWHGSSDIRSGRSVTEFASIQLE